MIQLFKNIFKYYQNLFVAVCCKEHLLWRGTDNLFEAYGHYFISPKWFVTSYLNSNALFGWSLSAYGLYDKRDNEKSQMIPST